MFDAITNKGIMQAELVNLGTCIMQALTKTGFNIIEYG